MCDLFLISLKRVALDFYKHTHLQKDVSLAEVVQELVTSSCKDGRIISALDIDSSSSTPEHLMMLSNKVTPVRKHHRQDLTTYRNSGPEAGRDRHQTFIVNFLIATTHANKEHLVDRIPPMSKNIQVELGDLADMIHHTALQIHGEGAGASSGRSNKTKDQQSLKEDFHTIHTKY